MALKKLHLVVAVTGIALAGAAAWWYQNRSTTAPGTASNAGPAAKNPAGSPPGPGAGGAPGGGGGPVGPVPVEVGRAEVVRIEDNAQAVGSLRANQSVVVRPEVSGRIRSLGFVDGQRVRRGQLLLQLDDTLQAAQLSQAEAQASIARTNLSRSRELAAQNFVSQSAVDQNAAALQVAEAGVVLAQAQRQRMKVLAPFDGTVGLRSVDVGDYVKDGADIVSIEDLSSLTVQFALPERYIDRLRQGQPVELSFDALPGREFKASVKAVDPQVDANGRALRVEALVANPGALLRPGMFARPRVVFAVREAAVVVPEEALVPVGTKQFLFKVVDGPDGQKTSQRLEARLGIRLPGKVEVLEGLKAGDMVVTAGHARLLRADGVPLRVVDLSRAAGSGGTGAAGGARASGSTASAPRAAAVQP
jgi:membrane fusion protein (multidrug efflux system)